MENTILIVDDEPSVLSSIKRSLVQLQYTVYTAENANEALEVLRQQEFKVILTDEKMPLITGSKLLSIVKKQFPNVVRTMLTGQNNTETALNAVNQGEIYKFLIKPWNSVDLSLTILSAVKKYNLESLNRKLLNKVKCLQLNLRILEKRDPTISRLEKNEEGLLMTPEITQSELSQLILECERDLRLENLVLHDF